MTIQEFSEAADITKDTIRYYERIGVLPRPMRNQNGYRVYTQAMVEEVRLLNRAKELGFSLTEIKELSTMLGAKKLRREDMGKRLQIKLVEIEAKITALNQLKKNIQDAVAGLCEFKNKIPR